MLRNRDLRRQVVNYVCPDGQNYYKCYTGSYAGCCSHDPCDTGHCGTNPSSNTGPCVADPNDMTVTVTVTQTNLGAQDSPVPVSHSVVATEYSSPSDPADVSSQSQTSIQASITEPDNTPTQQPEPIGQESSIRPSPTGNTSLTSSLFRSSSSNTRTHSQSTHTTITAPTPTTSPHSHQDAKTIAGATIGAVSGLALLSLLLYLCCTYLRRRRGQKSGKKLSININKKQNDKDLAKRKEALTEAEKVVAEREKALRDLESRGPVSPT